MKKRLLLVTGAPASGKTTLLLKVVEALKMNGYAVGGMITREVRSFGKERRGFEILDLSSDNRGWLASVDQEQGPWVGRYRVNIDDLNRVGVKAILTACESRDVIFIDEIGPMELFSEHFRQAVKKSVESRKLLICTVHWKMTNALIEDMRKREDAETYVVTCENRERLHETIAEKATYFLSSADEE